MSPHDKGATALAVPDWLREPVGLAPGVTLVTGAGGHPLLFHPGTGTYVRLSRTGASLVPLLDGTHTGTALLAAAGRSRGPEGVRDRAAALLTFLSDLRAAGVLSVPPEQLRGAARVLARLARLTPRVRIPARYLTRLIGPPAAAMARFPRLAVIAALLVAAASATAVIMALTLPIAPVFGGPRWTLILGALLTQAAVHELSHATACQALGIPVREAGVKLFCLLIPLTYVDRTDAYRIRSRAGRAAVALAGPLVDVAAAGLSSLLILTYPAQLSELRWLLGLQLIVVVNNLNPLLPTDGHHAVEAAIGELNMGHRASAYLAHALFRVPLSSAHRAISPARRRTYLAYGVVSTAFLAMTLTMIAINLSRLIYVR
ncbi:hypothetical protein ODJ79_26575 [Actinoplanes sp. KI2]|uniref:hypothetical protein n=1 Tax=Actinoplanes sp. KI2 TaxID=2983315 RepID=UPI0021D58F94|nr:hypothetical protein [Actinoplanes sp. KI2]MCU7727311.1 hypothetical protein [Actinoplanes sp. KI2]